MITRTGVLLAAALMVASSSAAEVRTESVAYRDGETLLEGYLAYDAAADRRSWQDMRDFLAEVLAPAAPDAPHGEASQRAQSPAESGRQP